MATAHKRTRIKTGPNSWINKTQRSDGTTSTSVSNKAGNTTTNISSTGVRRSQTNNGWTIRQSRGPFAGSKKTRSKATKQPSLKHTSGKPFDSNKFARDLEALDKRLDESAMNMENWSAGQMYAFIFIVTIICFVVQLLF